MCTFTIFEEFYVFLNNMVKSVQIKVIEYLIQIFGLELSFDPFGKLRHVVT